MNELSDFNILCLSMILDIDERILKTTRGESKRKKRILKKRKEIMSEITKNGFTEEYVENLITQLIVRENERMRLHQEDIMLN